MSKIEKVGDYFTAKINSKSEVFLLLFSGARTEAGKFNYMRSFSESDFNLIFLNCTESSYYHKGIQGLGELSETIEFIKTFIGQYSESPEIYTFGCSMGGYGSVLYGSLLDAKAVLAIGASTPTYSEMLNGHERRHEHYSIFEEQKAQLTNSSVKKIILYGDRTLNDILSYQFFSKLPNTTSKIYLEAPHVLVMLLAQVMPLPELVQIMLEGELEKIPFESTVHYNKSAWLIDYSDSSQVDGINAPENFLSTIDSLDFSDLTYTEFYIVGVACLKLKLPEKALKYFKLSLSKLFNIRVMKKILDMNLARSELLEVLLVVNKGICKGDLSKFERPEFEEGYVLYNLLHKKLVSKIPLKKNIKIPGFVDGVFGSSIKGWCYTEGVEKQGVLLHINDVLTSENKSVSYRKDLEDHGFSDGKHGFAFVLNLKMILKSMIESNHVEANIIDKGTNEVLPNGRMLIKAPYPLLHIDNYEVEDFSGWAVDYAYPTRKIILDVFVNKVFVRRLEPEVVRGDLESKGFHKTSGFNISLVGLLKTGPNTLVFKDSETGLNVSNVINIKG